MAIYPGAPWANIITLQNADGTVSNWTGIPLRMQIRPSYDSTEVYVDATTANGKLVWTTPASAIFTITLSGSDTSGIPVATQVFDVVRTDTGVRLFGGKVLVKGLVTR